MDQQLNSMERVLDEIRDALKRRADPNSSPSKNVNTIRVEGAGSIWHGIAIGIALGAVIVGTGWISAKVQEMDFRSRQSEAYKAAVYMLAPRFAEEIEKELSRNAQEQKEANKL